MDENQPEKPRFQFSLRTALIALVLAAVLLFVNTRCSFRVAIVINSLAIVAASITTILFLHTKRKRGATDGAVFNAMAEGILYIGFFAIIWLITR